MSVGIVTGLEAEVLLATGLGRVAAGGGLPDGAARVAAELVRSGASCLLSFGLAGGLDPALQPGTLIIPEGVVDHGEMFAADPGLLARLGGATHRVLVSAEAVVARAADKRALFATTGAVAVDLESGAVARSGVPFAVLRAICDPGDRDLPPAALLALDQAGAIGLWRVLRSLAMRPAQLPALLGLARDAARARGALVRRVHDIRGRGGLVG